MKRLNRPNVFNNGSRHEQLSTNNNHLMQLTIIIPALNEEKTIGDVIRAIPGDIPGIDEQEVLLVDDGSSDRTVELAERAGAEVVSHPENLGVGAAFNTGLEEALERGADIIVNMDADGQFNPDDIPGLIRPILEQDYGFVTCTRFGNPDYEPDMPGVKLWGNAMMCRLINWIIRGGTFTDVSCGFRAYSREAALRLTLFGKFTYTQETFIDLASKDVRMTEVPLRVKGEREHGESRIASNLWRYGTRAGIIILRAMRDTRPLTFFGSIGLAVFLLGAICGLFVVGYWAVTGGTSGVQSVLFGSATFLIVGFLLGVLALVADMLGRVKQISDEALYLERKRSLDNNGNH